MTSSIIPISTAIPPTHNSICLATVTDASGGTATRIRMDDADLPHSPAGQLSHVPALQIDDRVAIAHSAAGPIIIGKLKAPDQPAAATVTASEKGITVLSAEGIELRSGDVTITLSADGRIRISGDRVVTRAAGELTLQGATVKIN